MSAREEIDCTGMLQGVARRHFGLGVAVAAQDPRRSVPGLLPAERAAVADAPPARQRAFAAGRAAARAALSEIGIYGQPVLIGEGGAPEWPGGAVGSLAHSDTACLAAVGLSDRILSVGIGLDPATPLGGEEIGRALSPEETDRLATLPASQRGLLARAAAAAKTTACKCQYPLTGTRLDPKSLDVTLDPDRKMFHVVRPGGHREERMSGHYAILVGHVLTSLVLRRA